MMPLTSVTIRSQFTLASNSVGHQGHLASDEVEPLGQDVKNAIATMSRLETLGLQKLNVSIPRCIVLGQQSTGKSSVIEAISGIKTPRDTGTCTCCPLYITMQPSDDPNASWSARVSLQLDYALELVPRKSGPLQPFPGWVPAQTSQHVPFAETKSPTELEKYIRCAQTAILCPLESPSTFLTDPEPRKGVHRSKFSPNLVRIDITHPGLPTLSFFDLPGIISQAETEEEAHTVPLVKNLVAEYVKKPGSLILVTCDLGTDIANSTAAGLARQHNATDRCIGVLTKPDLLPPGTPDKTLIDVLDGKRFKLGHQYFVVKNLNKEEIKQGFTHGEARVRERDFFMSGRWASTLQRFQSRFGTRNPQLYLSKQLAKQTLDNLPDIHQQISCRLEDVETEIRGIPETPAHSAVRTISDILLNFSGAVRNEMEGEHHYTTWRNTWEGIQRAFDDALVAMKPAMSTSGSLDRGIFLSTLPGKSADDSIVIDSGDEDDNDGDATMSNMPETPTKKRKRETATPASSPFKMPTKPSMGIPTHRPEFARITALNMMSQPASFAQFKKKFKLDEVTREVNQNSKSKVPGQIHPKVRESMMLSALEKWHLPIAVFFHTLEKELVARVQSLFEDSFREWKGSELHQNAWSIVRDLLRNNINEQKTTMAAESLNDEREGPYIYYKDQFNREKVNMLEKYSQHRLRIRFRLMVTEAESHYGRDLSQAEQDKLRKDEKKMALVSQEPYKNEIDLIGDISSYYNIAARRLHDSICMRIESKFFKQLRTQLRDELESGLCIYDDKQGPQIAQRLLAESPDREKRRQELVCQRDALLEGLSCLDELRQQYHGSSSSNPMKETGLTSFGSGTFDPSFLVAHSKGMEDVVTSSLRNH
ncbi:dynamin family protein-like protein [Pyrenochaeta sp. MPI-SDFR-AT-0127]|nr:dynamin family protein-like protein [Pyrenochaeta sp. MPI-SDFR-AT-0127]